MNILDINKMRYTYFTVSQDLNDVSTRNLHHNEWLALKFNFNLK